MIVVFIIGHQHVHLLLYLPEQQLLDRSVARRPVDVGALSQQVAQVLVGHPLAVVR
jgi:hypothetical protein